MFFFYDKSVWPVYVGVNVCLILLFMYTYVCMHMQERLVTAHIDMYENKGHHQHVPRKDMVFE